MTRNILKQRQRLSTLLALALVFLCVNFVLGAKPKPFRPPKAKPDTTDEIFTNGIISTIYVEISSNNMAALRQSSHKYVRAVVKEGGRTWEDVGVHLKGSAGSVRSVDENPALTLNFDKYVDRQKFHGLDKVHLNNSVQDASMLTELLCGEMFRASGVPAARTTHARVFLNGKDLKLYVVKEGFDKTFLRRYFNNPKGNLYDGGFLRDITEPLEKLTGNEPDDRHELKALAAAALEPDPMERVAKLDKLLDMDRFISLMVMEIMTFHWDGYVLKKNNYKLYHDPETDKITFFPHGMDQMFWDPNFTIYPRNVEGMVARGILESSEGKKRYRERVGVLFTNVFNLEALTNRVLEIQTRIRPVLASISADEAKNHDGQVKRIIDLLKARAVNLQAQINLPEPKPLQFDSTGVATLKVWEAQNINSNAQLDKGNENGKALLHIRAGADQKCIASWRTRVLLEAGEYRFDGMVKTAGVLPLPPPKQVQGQPEAKEKKGLGAGIRIHNSTIPRDNQALGDTSWQKVSYEFSVKPGEDEKTLVCELRAAKGDAWFEIDSLKIYKLPPKAPAPEPAKQPAAAVVKDALKLQ